MTRSYLLLSLLAAAYFGYCVGFGVGVMFAPKPKSRYIRTIPPRL